MHTSVTENPKDLRARRTVGCRSTVYGLSRFRRGGSERERPSVYFKDLIVQHWMFFQMLTKFSQLILVVGYSRHCAFIESTAVLKMAFQAFPSLQTNLHRFYTHFIKYNFFFKLVLKSA